MTRELTLSDAELAVACMALTDYVESLEDRYKRSDYLFHSHHVEKYKLVAEENRIQLLARMRQADGLRDKLISLLPCQQI